MLQSFPLLVEYQRSSSDNLIKTVDIAKMLPCTVDNIYFKLFSFDHNLGLFFPQMQEYINSWNIITLKLQLHFCGPLFEFYSVFGSMRSVCLCVNGWVVILWFHWCVSVSCSRLCKCESCSTLLCHLSIWSYFQHPLFHCYFLAKCGSEYLILRAKVTARNAAYKLIICFLSTVFSQRRTCILKI